MRLSTSARSSMSRDSTSSTPPATVTIMPLSVPWRFSRKTISAPMTSMLVTFDVPPNRIKHFLNQSFEEKDCQVRALFSIPFGIANALVRKEVRIEHYTDDYIRDPKVLALIKKITLVPNLPLGKNHAGRLTVKLKNGQEFSAYREDPLGWLDSPTSFEEIRNKFMRNVEFSKTVPQKNAVEGTRHVRTSRRRGQGGQDSEAVGCRQNKMTYTFHKEEHSMDVTLVTGVIGEDVHNIGIKVLEHAFRNNGFQDRFSGHRCFSTGVYRRCHRDKGRRYPRLLALRSCARSSLRVSGRNAPKQVSGISSCISAAISLSATMNGRTCTSISKIWGMTEYIPHRPSRRKSSPH